MINIYYIFVFVAKVLDNMLGTAKTLLVQKNQALLASISLAVSNLIYFYLTKDVVLSNSNTSLYIVAIASGVGCYLAMHINDRFSKEKTYVNIMMSDDIDAMKDLRDFLACHKITNVANDSYTKDWSKKTLTITAYATTKDESKIIDNFVEDSNVKYKRIIQIQHT